MRLHRLFWMGLLWIIRFTRFGLFILYLPGSSCDKKVLLLFDASSAVREICCWCLPICGQDPDSFSVLSFTKTKPSSFSLIKSVSSSHYYSQPSWLISVINIRRKAYLPFKGQNQAKDKIRNINTRLCEVGKLNSKTKSAKYLTSTF